MQAFVTHGVSPVQHLSVQDSIEQPGAEYTPLAYAICPKFDSIVLHIDFGEGQIEVLMPKKTQPKRNKKKCRRANYLLDNANPDSDENRSLRKYAQLLRAVPNVTAEFSAIVC